MKTPRKILVTGNMGYVGPVLIRHLRRVLPGATLVGFDAGYFAHCLIGDGCLPERRLDAQYFGDLREIPMELMDGVDAVVHLGAISNDPMGNRFERVTEEINDRAGATLATMALQQGVRRFVFASSCSIYGFAEGGPRAESDQLNPLTAYARSKVRMEQHLQSIAADGDTITSLRFATACGMSDRLRLDLVLNDFVASAVSSGCITILSDGSPWRPLIDVSDMARAIEWALVREERANQPYLALNVGCDDWNFQVRELAESVRESLPSTTVRINPDAAPDRRSYRVDFSLFRSLAPQHQPQSTLKTTIKSLIEGLHDGRFTDSNFRDSSLIRLKVLDRLVACGKLSEDLRWCA